MANMQTGFPGPPGGASSSPGGTPGMSGPRPQSAGPGTPQMAPGGVGTPSAPPQLASPTKEFNTATLCKLGQEMVQDIVNKTSEVFNFLKAMQLPNGTNVTMQAYQDRKTKFEEHVKSLENHMTKLRYIYTKVQESTRNMESRPVEELLPIEENGEVKGEKPKVSEAVAYVSDEHRELVEQIRIKNRLLKEIIDQFRTMVWEINTMMAMRKS